MRLVRRMWLLGAVLPAVLALLGGVAGTLWYGRSMQRAVDEALLTQAAVEAVSLFDGPGNQLHLHMERSPLEESVRPFAPHAFVYGPHGDLLLSHPMHRDGCPRVDRASAPSGPPSLLTLRGEDGQRWREVHLRVMDPSGVPHVLRMSASLGPLDAAYRLFVLVALAFYGLFVAVLVMVQAWHGHWLTRGWAGSPPSSPGSARAAGTVPPNLIRVATRCDCSAMPWPMRPSA